MMLSCLRNRSSCATRWPGGQPHSDFFEPQPCPFLLCQLYQVCSLLPAPCRLHRFSLTSCRCALQLQANEGRISAAPTLISRSVRLASVSSLNASQTFLTAT